MIQEIEISKLLEHEENKEYFDDLIGIEFEELKDSISRMGIIDPLTVKEVENGFYKIISGNQRYRAAKEIGLSKLPCIVKKFKNIEEEVTCMVDANIRRRQLTTSQKAKALYMLYKKTSGRNKKEKIKKISKVSEYGQRNIASLISIEEKMIPELKPIIDKGSIDIRKAGSIANLSPQVQYYIYEELKNVATQHVKDELNRVYEENIVLLKKAKKAEKQYDDLKDEMAKLRIRGNDPLSEKDTGLKEIVADIFKINTLILELLKKCSQYNVSLKDIKLADYKKINTNFLDNYYPPATPIFKLINKEDIEAYIENSNNAEKAEELFKEAVLNYLD